MKLFNSTAHVYTYFYNIYILLVHSIYIPNIYFCILHSAICDLYMPQTHSVAASHASRNSRTHSVAISQEASRPTIHSYVPEVNRAWSVCATGAPPTGEAPRFAAPIGAGAAPHVPGVAYPSACQPIHLAWWIAPASFHGDCVQDA